MTKIIVIHLYYIYIIYTSQRWPKRGQATWRRLAKESENVQNLFTKIQIYGSDDPKWCARSDICVRALAARSESEVSEWPMVPQRWASSSYSIITIFMLMLCIFYSTHAEIRVYIRNKIIPQLTIRRAPLLIWDWKKYVTLSTNY